MLNILNAGFGLVRKIEATEFFKPQRSNQELDEPIDSLTNYGLETSLKVSKSNTSVITRGAAIRCTCSWERLLKTPVKWLAWAEQLQVFGMAWQNLQLKRCARFACFVLRESVMRMWRVVLASAKAMSETLIVEGGV
jgi:hypothetical protein